MEGIEREREMGDPGPGRKQRYERYVGYWVDMQVQWFQDGVPYGVSSVVHDERHLVDSAWPITTLDARRMKRKKNSWEIYRGTRGGNGESKLTSCVEHTVISSTSSSQFYWSFPSALFFLFPFSEEQTRAGSEVESIQSFFLFLVLFFLILSFLFFGLCVAFIPFRWLFMDFPASCIPSIQRNYKHQPSSEKKKIN